MLVGQHLHTIDDKNRLSLPSKFRKELGKGVVVTRGLDRSLFVYSQKEWKTFSGRIGELSMGQSDSRALSRFLFGGAVEANIDASGRILIPDFLKQFANLEGKVVVVGMHNRVELWNENEWENYSRSVEKEADTLSERLGEIGMI